jgi:dimethylglycine dehydrogenase
MNALRLEKGYRAWGSDFTTERTPIEAGIENLIKTNNRKFTGRDALQNHDSRPEQKRMVLLEINGTGPDPYFSHPVFLNNKVIGIVTSGAYGHRTDKKLALAYIDVEHKDSRDEVEVEILGEKCPAVILDKPPYDPENKRLRGLF